MKKKIIALVIFIFLCISLSTISVNAHSESLNIEYDDCLPDYFVDDNDFGDGYYEKWYQLYDRSNKSIHMSHSSTTTIKYYFKDLSRNGQVSWNDYLSEEEEIEFKNAFADSIKKWNNIYVYRLNNGYYEKIKLVNIVEGNENNSNLFIWPGNSGDLAITTPSPTSSPDDEMLETKNDIIHLHINIWDTIINLDDYKNNLINNLENKTKVFERLGAHELGHLLGLSDIDYTENHINGELYHHEEVLMGYSNTKTDISINSNRQTEITYKDIIGAAITRGYHNDNNHKWLCDEQLYEGNYKLICKLCNGVKYINTLSEINYDLYKSCNNNHDLEEGKSKSKWLSYYMGIRASVFDEWLEEQMIKYPEAVVVHIGCGLDSRVLRVGTNNHKWYDVDFPDVIAERRKYYSEDECYKMIDGDARESGWLANIPYNKHAILVLEGISMYLTNSELKKLISNIGNHFENVNLLMDCYSMFAAKMSKYKNPVNDIGVTQVYGLDNPKLIVDSNIFFKKEHEMTPIKYIEELEGLEKFIFRKLYAGNLSKKLYKLYEFEKY